MDEHDKKIAEQLNLDIIITKGIRANMSPTIIARTIQEIGYTKNKFDIKKIMDKIDGEIECARKSNIGIDIEEIVFKDILTSENPEELLVKVIQRVYNTGYYSGKTKLGSDLKTWIQENIKE